MCEGIGWEVVVHSFDECFSLAGDERGRESPSPPVTFYIELAQARLGFGKILPSLERMTESVMRDREERRQVAPTEVFIQRNEAPPG